MRAGWLVVVALGGCAPYPVVLAPKGEDLSGEDTDLVSQRTPGPNVEERELVTAWLQKQETLETTVDPSKCTDQTTEEWRAVFEPPAYEADKLYYVFYRVAADGRSATNQNCAAGYPDGCTDREPVYEVDGNRLRGVQPAESALEGDCTLHLDNVITVEDRGDRGTLTFGPSVYYTGGCPAEVATNDGCVVTHTFALEWAAAR